MRVSMDDPLGSSQQSAKLYNNYYFEPGTTFACMGYGHKTRHVRLIPNIENTEYLLLLNILRDECGEGYNAARLPCLFFEMNKASVVIPRPS